MTPTDPTPTRRHDAVVVLHGVEDSRTHMSRADALRVIRENRATLRKLIVLPRRIRAAFRFCPANPAGIAYVEVFG